MDMRRAESVVNAITADLPPACTAALDHVLTIVRFCPCGRGRAFLQFEDLPLSHSSYSPHRAAPKSKRFKYANFTTPACPSAYFQNYRRFYVTSAIGGCRL
jgi:hypothetical protein